MMVLRGVNKRGNFPLKGGDYGGVRS